MGEKEMALMTRIALALDLLIFRDDSVFRKQQATVHSKISMGQTRPFRKDLRTKTQLTLPTNYGAIGCIQFIDRLRIRSKTKRNRLNIPK